ncbi:endonuclease/exonuclease/phosphatase family protein [Streptomyces adelaidensis]|uniref:endonuclease/exonuclease/phosphatase family protein n=1 Tax=Streptomyces adelaidensis TaxID=2796465 RepID=UPI001907D4DD|nr:endonuclease/exonuclease/phosphatase family protein [Streptomyces adelaidensis]
MRVMTWNLWWRFGPWQERQKAILAVLRELRPDVVGLQEVWEQDGESLAGWLAGELGMHATWGSYGDAEAWQRRIGDPGVGIGNAVLSRWPVLERESIALPTGEGHRGRGALYALIDAPGHPVPFFTTHLSSATDGSTLRCHQVTTLARFVARHRGGTPFPAVVTGDFNAWPDSDEVRLFGGYRTAPAVPGQCLFDVWEYAEPGAPSATWDKTNPYVAATFGPSVRIDYIHVGPPGPGGLGHVRAVRRAGDGPPVEGGVWPSDHAAVVADLAETGVGVGAETSPNARPRPGLRP